MKRLLTLLMISSLLDQYATKSLLEPPPYAQLDDDDVRLHFSRGDFPATDGFYFGTEISDCWNGNFVSFNAILSAIEEGAYLKSVIIR
jgi:hypothetical protein